jgi:hypothetical protein
MNKTMLSICLEEIIFDKENQDLLEGYLDGDVIGKVKKATGFSKAEEIGRSAFTTEKEKEEIVNGIKAWKAKGKPIDSSAIKIKKDIDKYRSKSKAGADLAQIGLAGAYAGGAFLLYKGIKSLYKKYKEAKTPEAKAQIKSQIDSKKIQLKKAKAKGKK